MPIKINDSNQKDVNKRLKKNDVREMVQHHRNNKPFKKAHFSHFMLTEILTLFRDNGVIDFTKPLQSQLTAIKDYGVKFYSGVHFKPETCDGKPDYLNHSNIIICNTKDDGSNFYKDMLDDNKSISFSGAFDGLDMGQICPPECGGTDDVV
ncbi:hypothetical protein [Daejeonella sp. JGW-45]|uniref:hypothetical protein n=1 Tax=Daejeonella sp. JGW-45 TaxID=3034148 RepID=UPI0023EC3A00|nr:hypothetical protein [Daejeonella sp. JGW-45]